MVALKGKSDIGDKINTQVIQPLIDANARLARSDFPDFNDPNKLGEGGRPWSRTPDQPDRIFQKPALDFSQNRAEHDDILGDAYEYLMRHFASRERQEQGPVLHPVRGQPHHRQGDRHRSRQHQGRHHRLRPHLRLRLAAAEGGRRGGQAHHARRAGERT
jgi:hypothetical protein